MHFQRLLGSATFYGANPIWPQQLLRNNSDFLRSKIYATYGIEKTTPNQISNFSIFCDITNIG